MTSELEQTRYDQLIRRVCNMASPGSKVSEALSELFPMIDVERVPGELLALGGTRLGMGGGSVNAGAGLRPRVQLFNPVDSGVLATVSTVFISSSATAALRWVVTSVANPLGGLENQRDTRVEAIGPTTAIILLDGTQVGPIATQCIVTVAGNVFNKIDDANAVAVLAPGTGLTFESDSLGATLNCSFFWRERTAEPAELSLA